MPNKTNYSVGPKARRVLDRDSEFVSPSHTRLYPIVPDHGEGCWLWDVDGRKYLDFTSGIGVLAAGHAHPRVTAAIQQQAAKLAHFSAADFYPPLYVTLAERLAKLAPMRGPNKTFLCNSGTESVEAAIKLARYHTRRWRLVAFHNCFHGRTMGAQALTASKLWQQRGFGPTTAGVTHIAFNDAGLDHLENVLFRTNVPPEEVAAIFFEPIQGEGGLHVPSPKILRRLREICDRHGILLVADEVQTGLGRTGKMFACEHFGVVPDILCLAKALGGGLPLGAVVAPTRVMDWPIGAHTSTFGGNPVACAAALVVLDLLEENLVANALARGKELRKGLEKLRRKHPQIREVRGVGLLSGFTVARNRSLDNTARNAILRRAFERGLLLLGGGEGVVRLSPPLIVTKQEIETGLGLLDKTLSDLGK